MDLNLIVDQQELQGLGLVALAAALGGVVGLERELSGKPAGLRTHMFVAAAGTMLILLGDALLVRHRDEVGFVMNAGDPIRIIQAIVIGISFLGAGTIVHQGNDVEGLTTAASILLTAGIGIAVAIPKFTLAIGVTILAVLILTIVGWLERKVVGKR